MDLTKIKKGTKLLRTSNNVDFFTKGRIYEVFDVINSRAFIKDDTGDILEYIIEEPSTLTERFSLVPEDATAFSSLAPGCFMKADHISKEMGRVYGDTQGQNGMKFDAGKLRFSLLTKSLWLPLKSIVAVLTYGEQKYAADSWQTVPNARVRYEDALDRHLNAWKSGESFDPESGCHHLAHVGCNTLFLLWFAFKDLEVKHGKFAEQIMSKFNKVKKNVPDN